MSLGLLFTGQGAQHPEILRWLAPDANLQAVEQVVGAGWRQQLADPAWAGRNAIAQPLLTGLALAAWGQLAPLLPAPAALAGYSVGELAAFAAAGVYDRATAIALAQQRAELMDASGQAQPTGLLGISGLAPGADLQLCADFGLAVAVRNGIDSVVLGGPRAALPAAEQAARALGAHCTPLNVALASHTPWMASAAQGFAEHIAALPFVTPHCPLFSNADGRVTSPPQLRQALAQQIARTVQWDACMEGIASRQIRCVLEIGPGQALARMWNQRYPDIPARSVDEFRSAQAIAAWVGRWAD